MRQLQLLLIVLIAPMMCATSFAHCVRQAGSRPLDVRSQLEAYVYRLTAICDTQIDEIARMIPPQEVEQIRKEHYAWKLDRDLRCAEADLTRGVRSRPRP